MVVDAVWTPANLPKSRSTVRRFGTDRDLDSLGAESYLALIPIHRLPGGAFVRASVFRLGWVRDFLARRWGGWRPVELEEG